VTDLKSAQGISNKVWLVGRIWKYMEVYGGIWKNMEVYGSIRKYMEVY
jgi:hypothetical protein